LLKIEKQFPPDVKDKVAAFNADAKEIVKDIEGV